MTFIALGLAIAATHAAAASGQYRSDRWGFALTVPERWTTSEPQGGSIKLHVDAPPVEGGIAPVCSVRVDEYPQGGQRLSQQQVNDKLSATSMATILETDAWKNDQEPSAVASQERMVDGRKVVTVQMNIIKDGMPMATMRLYVFTPARGYLLLCADTPEHAPSSRPTIEALERSFRVLG